MSLLDILKVDRDPRFQFVKPGHDREKLEKSHIIKGFDVENSVVIINGKR